MNKNWKEAASLHGPFPLHANHYELMKIHGEVQPLPKRHLVKKPQTLCGDVKVPPGLRGAVFEESILWFVPLVAASQSFAQLSPAPQQSQGEQHTSWNALGWDV